MRAPAAVALVLLALPLAGCAEDTGGGAEPRAQDASRSFVLMPGRGVEFKLQMNEGDSVAYAWNATSALFFDFHGDRGADDPSFTSYEKGAAAADAGDFTAPFTGRHGWYWENRNRADVTIELDLNGTFTVIDDRGG